VADPSSGGIAITDVDVIRGAHERPPPVRDRSPPNTKGTTIPPGTRRLIAAPALAPRVPNLLCTRVNQALQLSHGFPTAVAITGPQQSFTERLDGQAALLLQAAISNSSEKRYDSHWKHWETFRGQYTVTPPDDSLFLSNSSLTAKIRTVGAFIAYLHSDKSLRASTIVGAIAGLRHAFRSALEELDFLKDPRLTAVKHAVTMLDKKAGLGKTNRKLPFTLDMVQHLLQISDLSVIHYHMCAVAIQLSYFGLYRSSEIVHDPEAELHHEAHALRTSDAFFLLKEGGKIVPYSLASSIPSFDHISAMRVILRSAKNDQARRGKKTFFTAQDFGAGTINIVRVLFDWAIRSRTQHGGILLSYWNEQSGSQSHLTYNNLTNTVKKIAGLMGFEKSKFAAHSPRIGGASTLRACKAPDPLIQMMGHWDSAETPRVYEEDNVREFVECQRLLAFSEHYSAEVVHIFQDQYLAECPGIIKEIDLCTEAI
jgi:hypothetical protein